MIPKWGTIYALYDVPDKDISAIYADLHNIFDKLGSNVPQRRIRQYETERIDITRLEDRYYRDRKIKKPALFKCDKNTPEKIPRICLKVLNMIPFSDWGLLFADSDTLQRPELAKRFAQKNNLSGLLIRSNGYENINKYHTVFLDLLDWDTYYKLLYSSDFKKIIDYEYLEERKVLQQAALRISKKRYYDTFTLVNSFNYSGNKPLNGSLIRLYSKLLNFDLSEEIKGNYKETPLLFARYITFLER